MTFREAVAMLIGSGRLVRKVGGDDIIEVYGPYFDRVADMLEDGAEEVDDVEGNVLTATTGERQQG